MDLASRRLASTDSLKRVVFVSILAQYKASSFKGWEIKIAKEAMGDEARSDSGLIFLYK
jgi:hypothetical protein